MAILGPPRSAFGLFGGPGVIVALLLVLGAGVFIAYQKTGGRVTGAGATLSLPGEIAPGPAVPGADPATPLQTMPPLAAQDIAAPEAEPAAPMIEIDEDLSPAELLAEYPPDPALSLDGQRVATAEPESQPDAAPAAAQRLAVVATGLGLDRALTAQTIIAAPPAVSLSFGAGTEDLAGWIAAARAYGHEALVDLQLGAGGDAARAGSDLVLLAELGPAENLRRLDAILETAPKATGVAISITDVFLGDAAALTPILERLQAAGLIAVGLPVTAPLTVAADRVFEDKLETGGVARETLALKSLVRQRGAALVLASPENAMALARSWSQPSQNPSVELSLVPASSLAED